MPLFFVPARSSRHRRACFALYRALLRQGPRVPLPDDLSTASPLGPANPIQTLVRNGFRRNERDTSPRLVVSALKNGYRYLTLLSRAADPSTPEHSSVLSFLRENQTRVLALKAKSAASTAKRISTAPIEGRTPLITKISPEGHPPVYVPTGPPRPLSSFPRGVRKPPTLGATLGVPFLRIKKPQPRFLERVLRQKSQRRTKRLIKILEMEGEGMEEAAVEDAWEKLVEDMLRRQKNEDGGRGGQVRQVREKKERTYKDTIWETVVSMSDLTNQERLDLIARGKAMWQIVLDEQEMALQEEKERLVREGRGGEEPQLRVWKVPIHKRGRMTSTDQDSGKSPGQPGGTDTPEQA
ncbi:hypothetical protein C8A00DRAFT_17871 [Chaetomidium leptoderma]|uniref:Uncharacterized protein n=1 Tax=Chaetomidium leptoderma TaxID=669021 RepID=A0AAN6VFP3_9PEZI|nr:hypothetical protein C8A00DRAFT_17871 [Chaetomidium leptoderma]